MSNSIAVVPGHAVLLWATGQECHQQGTDWVPGISWRLFGFCIFPVHWYTKASAVCARVWACLAIGCSALTSWGWGGLLKPYTHNPFCLILPFSTANHWVPGFCDHGYDCWSNDAHQTLVWFHWKVTFLTLASGRTWEWHSHLQKTILEPPPSKLAKTLTFKPKKILNPWNHLSYPSKERETQNVLCSNL